MKAPLSVIAAIIGGVAVATLRKKWPGYLTGSFALLTGTLPVRNMHSDQCLCGSLPVLPVQLPKGGYPRLPFVLD